MELFDLWVEPTARSTGVAGRLLDTAATLAAGEGAARLYSWAGTENGPAIGFATGFGFRISSRRRPVTIGDHTLGDTEIALVLTLEDDPTPFPTPPLAGFATEPNLGRKRTAVRSEGRQTDYGLTRTCRIGQDQREEKRVPIPCK